VVCGAVVAGRAHAAEPHFDTAPRPFGAPRVTVGCPTSPLRRSPHAAPPPSRLVPYQAVIGEREAEAGGDLVAVRLRDGRSPGVRTGAELVGRIADRIADRVAGRGTGLWDAA
jgi:hypothetical protein